MSEYQTIPEQGSGRAVIEKVTPELDAGRFAIKRTAGEQVMVEADIFSDGHDKLSAVIKFRPADSVTWQETAMALVDNDRWRGVFEVAEPGYYLYTIEAWVNHFKSWRVDLQKKLQAGQSVSVDLQTGAAMIEAAVPRAQALDAERLRGWAKELRNEDSATGDSITGRALDESLAELMDRYDDRAGATLYAHELGVVVDRELARFGAWYEMFPRSFAAEPGKHGTFKDCLGQLERIARMGFDVLYLPPIHPIGNAWRKGKNNNVTSTPGEPGSPWAIGSAEGGHKAIHPQLGTFDDFQRLVEAAHARKLEIALDVAFQCSPDHPYTREHPQWFKHRPDGSIQYAENPPKKYQDIVPFDFECDDWRNLWLELKSVFDFWIERGIKIFRVDNPHTKNFAFWKWCVAELKRAHPDLILLAEAFTRPKPMYELAKIGFTQSYNYFPWRNTKDELTGYFTEVTQPPVSDFFRPNVWPNTPDILPQFLQAGGHAGFAIRFVLAATLAASYGIYGPAFELGENIPREPGAEEYLDSEKYEIKAWRLGEARPLENLIARVNQLRHEHPALQSDHHLRFHPVDNGQMIAYSKSTDDHRDIILMVVNLSHEHTHSGWLDLRFSDLQLDPLNPCDMHDVLNDARYVWREGKNYVELNPQKTPAHIFHLRPGQPR